MNQFTEELTSFVHEARGAVVTEPNIDTYRFGAFPQALKRYDDSYMRDGLAFLADNDDAVARMAKCFADDESRVLLKSVMAFRVLGPRYVRLPTNTPRHWQHYEDAATWRTGPSPRPCGRSRWRITRENFAEPRSASKAGSAVSSSRF